MTYTIKTFPVNGEKMKFNTYLFDSCFKDYCKKNGIRLGEMANQIADELNVSEEAVRNWRKGVNGPSDLEKISDLEGILGLKADRLLTIADGGKDMTKLTERQIAAAKRIYDVLVEFLNEFRYTDGFEEVCNRLRSEGEKDPISATYDYIEKREKEIYLVLEQEFFDLRGTELYTELNDFTYGDLVDAYNEKISSDYRVSASMEHDGITTDDDYYDAMEKLNAIIEKYI